MHPELPEPNPGLSSREGRGDGRLDVLVTSTSFPADLDDWRGVFIRHLTDALARRPDLAVQLWMPPGEHHRDARMALHGDDGAWLQQLMHDGGIAHLLRRRTPLGLARTVSLLRRLRRSYRRSDASLYHINWLQNALPLPDDRRPALVSVLGNDMALLRLPGMRAMLRRALRRRAAVLCPNADWMVGALTRGFGDVASIAPVAFGIDNGWYDLVREPVCEPSQDRPPVWLAVTRLTRNKLGTLFEWCEPHFVDGARELHLLGPMQEQVALPEWVRHHGAVSSQALRESWFPRAHGLITLSQHAEGRPQVMLEAMAAGLPIIASRQPAHEDLIQHRETGWLCAQAADVPTALAALEDPHTNHAIGRRARAWVGCEIGTWDDCAARYVKLYKDLIDGHAT